MLMAFSTGFQPDPTSITQQQRLIGEIGGSVLSALMWPLFVLPELFALAHVPGLMIATMLFDGGCLYCVFVVTRYLCRHSKERTA